MQETIRLFDRDPYQRSFTARVLSCTEGKKGYEIILDQTCFFPEEGGQSPDQGTIAGIPVTDVKIKQDVITHFLPSPLSINQEITGEICWEHRFSNMQQHSGEHIVTGLIHNRFGYDNVGFHLSDQNVTLDINGTLTKEEIAEIETAANEIVVKNLPTVVTYPSKEELKTIEYRSKIEIPGQVRLVTFPGVDTCACCAPHVARTGEIGLIKIAQAQNYKGGMRIFILCGFRALEDYRFKQQITSSLSSTLSAKPEKICEGVDRLQQEISHLKAMVSRYQEAAIREIAEKIPSGSGPQCLFLEDMDANVQRKLVNLLTERCSGVNAVFCGCDGNYRYIIGSNDSDCRAFATLLRSIGGKGGGTAQMVQGSISASQDSLKALMQEGIVS